MNMVISINKPVDITSHDVVQKVKRILKVKKAGHTGTLDPIAAGLMIVCLNKATRLASYFSGLGKEYKAVMKLGETTDTQDAYGDIVSKTENINVEEAVVKEVFRSFEGTILQQPPMFSALKHKGRSLYKYAREGVEIDRKPREVHIDALEVLNIRPPYVSFKTVCTKGTYIRTLCHDIGHKLGTGAHLYSLERTAVGPFRIEESIKLEDLESLNQREASGRGVYTMDEAVSWLPEYSVEEAHLKAVQHGNPVKLHSRAHVSGKLKQASGIRVKSPDGKLLAIGHYSELKNVIKMDMVFV